MSDKTKAVERAVGSSPFIQSKKPVVVPPKKKRKGKKK